MRVTEGMYVSHGAIDLSRRLLEYLGKLRRVQVPGRADLNSRIATLCDQWRKPANLQLQPDANQNIRLAKFEQKARLGLYEVRVLIALRNRFDVDAITADLLRQCRHVSCRCDYIELLGLCGTEREAKKYRN